MNRLKVMMFALIALLSFSVFITPQVTLAQVTIPTTTTGGNGVKGGLGQLEGSQSGVLTPAQAGVTDNGRGAIVQLIGKIINYMLYLAGAIAVLFVIIGGYQYLTSGGNEDGAKKGRTTVTNALIGVVIVILAYIVVNVVVNFITN